MMKSLRLPENVRWIGLKRAEGFPIETAFYRTAFELKAVPAQAPLTLSANTRYILYVNGVEIIRGPCRGGQRHQYADAVDISPWLRPGSNVLAARVTAFPPVETAAEDGGNLGPTWAMSPCTGPVLLVCGQVAGVDVSTGVAPWFGMNDRATRWHLQREAFWLGCAEEVDGAAYPHGWQSEACAGKDFRPVTLKWDTVIRYGITPPLYLHERPIPYLIRDEIRCPFIVSQTSGFHYPVNGGQMLLPARAAYEVILDAQRLTTAFVYLRTIAGRGSSIRLTYAEAFTRSEGTRPRKGRRGDPAGQLLGVEDVYHPGGGTETYSPAWLRTFRFLRVAVKTGDEPLTLLPLRFVETRYPLANKVRFDTDQAWVRGVWDISLRTLELCMHESYEDCPYYEQLQYTMDTRLQMLYTLAISNDARLPGKTMHDFHASLLPEGILQSRFPSNQPQVIPVFALHWILMLYDLYMETGDAGLLERYRPTMESVLGWFDRKMGASGLVEHLGYWDFSDWTEAWQDTHGAPHAAAAGPSTIQNLVYCYALDVGARILDALGLTQLSDLYRGRRRCLLHQIQALCWSETRGLYQEGPGFDEYSQHAQIWAVLNGLITGEKARALMRRTIGDGSLVPCSFVMQFYLFRALEAVGMYGETRALWTLWRDLLELELTTVPEIPGPYTRSDCHAWGALMLYEMPRSFLGVSPRDAGYKSIRIQVEALYLGRLSGEVPTPRGMVTVSWRVEDGRFSIRGDTPVDALLVMPDGAVHALPPGAFAFESSIHEDGYAGR